MEFFKEGDEDINLTGLSSEFLKTVIVKKYISFDKANRLLRERGKVVYRDKYPPSRDCVPIWLEQKKIAGVFSHQALLICLEEVEPDSAEKILADLSAATAAVPLHKLQEFLDRAKKLRGGK